MSSIKHALPQIPILAPLAVSARPNFRRRQARNYTSVAAEKNFTWTVGALFAEFSSISKGMNVSWGIKVLRRERVLGRRLLCRCSRLSMGEAGDPPLRSARRIRTSPPSSPHSLCISAFLAMWSAGMDLQHPLRMLASS